MKMRKIEYYDGDTLLEATVASEGSLSRPIILVFHAWAGKDEFAEEKAKELARLGYVGCALDIYGKGVLGRSNEENSQLMGPFMKDRKRLQKRILAYRSLLAQIPEANPSKIGAIGYCFGGLCALDLARSAPELAAVASFHALFSPPSYEETFPIQAKVLALHGFDDPSASQEDLRAFGKEMSDRKADWQLHVFGGTMHAFTNPKADDPSIGNRYNPVSDGRSWHQMKLLFSEVFSLG